MKNILLLLLFFVSSNLSGQNYKVDKSRIETNFIILKNLVIMQMREMIELHIVILIFRQGSI